MAGCTKTITIESLIESDINLFRDSFRINFDWNAITFTTNDKCTTEYLSRHKNYDPNDEHPIFYSPTTNTVVHDKILVQFDYVRFHEMGHVVHDKLLGYKRFTFPTGWQKSLVKHWNIPSYRRPDYLEVFADVFAETMLRLKHNCVMANYNVAMQRLVKNGGAILG